MGEQKPPPWFDKQGAPKDDQELKRRLEKLMKDLPRLTEQRRKDRAHSFLPYLLIRSVLGDRGDRPINVPFWESPDIWTAPGDPAMSPAIPPDHGGVATAGQPNTVYAHVWNLGFAPLAGIRVEFYWFNPSLSIDASHANLIGMTTVELAGRGMAGSHKLVKCPKPWVPVMENGGHECLLVRISGIGDPIGGNPWQPWLNRHVGQRNVSVVSAGASLAKLIGSLNATRLKGTRLQLVQLGAAEGELARHIAAPKLKLSDVGTRVIAELDAEQRATAPQLRAASPAMLAPVHALAAGGAPKPPAVTANAAGGLVDLSALVQLREPVATAPKVAPTIARAAVKAPAAAAAAAAASARARTAHLADFLETAVKLNQRAKPVVDLARGTAHAIRIATYQGDQLVGGYTFVVAGKK